MEDIHKGENKQNVVENPVRCKDCRHMRREKRACEWKQYPPNSKLIVTKTNVRFVCYVAGEKVWCPIDGYIIKPDYCERLNTKGNCPFFSKKKSFLEKIKVQKG